MNDADMDRGMTRLEAKREALETYPPALLDSVQRSQDDMRAILNRVESAVRVTKTERLAVVIGLFTIAATLAANLFSK